MKEGAPAGKKSVADPCLPSVKEGGIDWVPMILSRLRSMERMAVASSIWKRSELTPAEMLLRNMSFSALWDSAGFRLLDEIGVDNVLLECDYPHGDSTFPNTQEYVGRQLGGLGEDAIRKITFENACRVYRHPEPVGFVTNRGR